MKYHKIQTIYKRDPNNMHQLLEGQYSKPEFEYLKDNIWDWTEKVDGTNVRVMWDGHYITFGGKTDNAQLPTPLLNRLVEITIPEKFREVFNDNAQSVCIYGEGFGAKIQKVGAKYSPTQEFVMFDIRIGNWWLKRKDVEGVASKLGLGTVPYVGSGTLNEAVDCVKYGIYSCWDEMGLFEAEGLVLRPKIELKTRSGERVIAKIKCRDFREEGGRNEEG